MANHHACCRHPDMESSKSWLALLAAFATQCFGMSSEVFFSVAYLDLMDKFGASRGNVGVAISLVLSVGSVLSVLCSPVIDRHGCRYTLLVGAAMASTGFFVCSWSSSIVVFHIFYGCIAGSGWIMNAHVGQTIVQQAFRHNRGLATGICLLGLSIGQLVGAIWSRFILDSFGVSGAFLLMSGLHMQMLVLAFAVPYSSKAYFNEEHKSINLKETLAETDAHTLSKEAKVPPNTDEMSPTYNYNSSYLKSPKEVEIYDSLRQIDNVVLSEMHEEGTKPTLRSKLSSIFATSFFKDPKYVLYIFVRLTWLSCKYGLVHHSVSAAVGLGVSTSKASYLPSVVGMVNLIMKIVSTIILNVRKFNKTAYFLVGIMCNLGAALVAAFGTSYEWMILAMIFLGFNEGIATTAQPVVVVSLVGTEAFARGFSIVNLTMVPASFISGPLYGYLADVTSGYMIPFLVASGFASVAVVLVIIIILLGYKKVKPTSTSTSTDDYQVETTA